MKSTKTPSGSRILVFGLLWAATYIICLLSVKELSPGKGVGILLSLLPAVTFALFIYNFIKGVSAMDEVERRIQLEASVFGFALGLLLLMTLGLLDLVVHLKKEDWGYRHLVPYFFIFYLLGIVISKRKYFGNEKHD